MTDICCHVPSISSGHLNRNSNSSDDIALVRGYQRRSSLTLFIPELIDLDVLLRDNPPDFNYQKDCFVYLFHVISSITSNKWDIMDSNGFVPVNRQVLQNRIHDYKKYISYCIEMGIIVENKHYIPTKKSKGLKFSSRYESNLKPVNITKHTLIKSITTFHKNINIEKSNEIHFLKKWFNSKLKVDLPKAKRLLEKLKRIEMSEGSIYAQQSFNSRILPLLQIMNGEYSFAVDNTGYRLHTCITRTMKELRRFITYDNKKLVSIDIVNSQPYFTKVLFSENYFYCSKVANKIVNTNLTTQASYPNMLVKYIRDVKKCDDVSRFLSIVKSGEFYEEFAKILKENNLYAEILEKHNYRDEIKKIVFSALYSPNTSISYNEELKVFAKIFPNVYGMIRLIKQGKGKHNSFAILLQRLEAELILDKICVRIKNLYPNIPIFTLHDSIVTIEQYVVLIKGIMTKILKEYIGASPQFKIEKWE